MSIPTHVFLAGALLAVPLSHSVQCGRAGSSAPCDAPPVRADAPPVLASDTEQIEELGKRVFFDNISVPKRMSCSTCHDPAAGWTFKNAGVNQHQVAVTGADPHRAGALKPPSNAYASETGRFRACNLAPVKLCGGNFWNGRAEGNATPLFPKATAHVGDEVFEGSQSSVLSARYAKFLGPVADQALNPFPNLDEQNIEARQVCKHVAAAKYAPLFALVWGEPIDCGDQAHGNTGFKAFEVSFRRLAVALAAWQASPDVNSFSSRRDAALAADADGKFPLDDFTAQENLGHDLFYATFLEPVTIDGKQKFANCALCHTDNPAVAGGAPDDGDEEFQLYSDDSYHNIGVPPNPEIAGFPKLDPGLEGHTGDPKHRGLRKTPTLRNVDKRPGKGFTKAYTHDGWFKSLESIVHFYNTAHVEGATAKSFGITRCDPGRTWTEQEALAKNCWPVPEFVDNVAIPAVVGDLGLTAEEEAAIVAYLRTFTDTHTPKAPKPYH